MKPCGGCVRGRECDTIEEPGFRLHLVARNGGSRRRAGTGGAPGTGGAAPVQSAAGRWRRGRAAPAFAPVADCTEAHPPAPGRRAAAPPGPRGTVLAVLPFGAPLPGPVLWRDTGDPDATPERCGTVLCAGEVGMLAGPGEALRSRLPGRRGKGARLAGCTSHGDGWPCCRTRIPAPGSRIGSPGTARRTNGRTFGGRKPPPRCGRPTPRTGALPAPRHTGGPWWTAVREWGARLVVIDPASVAAAGISPSDGAAVRAFLLAVQREAAQAGAGAVAGSGQWIDGPRGVLHLSGRRSR